MRQASLRPNEPSINRLGQRWIAKRAPSGGASRVAFDPNYRERLWPDPGRARELLARVLGTVDIALPTFDDEHALHGDDTPQSTVARIIGCGAGEVVVKCGASPAVFQAGDLAGSLAAELVERPVDTTGAGDAFNGGYLSARLNGADIRHAVKKGHEVAASAVATRGALIGLSKST